MWYLWAQGECQGKLENPQERWTLNVEMVGFDKDLYIYGLGDLGLKLKQNWGANYKNMEQVWDTNTCTNTNTNTNIQLEIYK